MYDLLLRSHKNIFNKCYDLHCEISIYGIYNNYNVTITITNTKSHNI